MRCTVQMSALYRCLLMYKINGDASLIYEFQIGMST